MYKKNFIQICSIVNDFTKERENKRENIFILIRQYKIQQKKLINKKRSFYKHF